MRSQAGILYDAASDYVCEEPRLHVIKALLESILRIVDICDEDGERLNITGFRLRDPADWLTHKTPSLLENLGSLSPVCNCACDFCYQRGNPFQYQRRRITMAEIRKRVDLFDPRRGRGVFLRMSYYFEPLCNPHLFEILELVRRKMPDETFYLTSNGALLTRDIIRRLAQFKPVSLYLSMNTSDPQLRRTLMRDAHPDVSIEAPRLLREHGIRYTGSIVAWPTLPMENMIDAIRWLDQWEASVIRVNLPGYTRFFDPEPQGVDDAFWWRVVEAVGEIRPQCATPVYMSPALFSQRHNRAIISGAVRNSPAARAGLRFGDEVVAVDGERVSCRPHAMRLLAAAGGEGAPGRPRLVVAREGREFEVTLEEGGAGGDHYPYRPTGYRAGEPPLGIFMVGGFDVSYIRDLDEAAGAPGRGRVLVMTSRLMRPLFEEALASLGSESLKQRLDVVTPENRFLGGNIFMGDLLLVSDYIACAQEYIAARGAAPALIVVPSSFMRGWGRDMAGVPYLEIERVTGVPVKVLACERVYD